MTSLRTFFTKRGSKSILLGLILFAGGAFVLPLIVVLSLFHEKPNEVQFIVPGEALLHAEKPGRYYVWNDFRTFYQGRNYHQSELIPDGVRIQISNSKGEPLELITDSSITHSSGSASRKSIGYVEVAHPDTLKIEVSGGDEPRVLSFAQSRFFKIFGRIMGGFALSALTALSGIGLTIWGIFKFSKSTRTNPSPAS
jgi:hypothetical protein